MSFSQILLFDPDSVKTLGSHCPLGEAQWALWSCSLQGLQPRRGEDLLGLGTFGGTALCVPEPVLPHWLPLAWFRAQGEVFLKQLLAAQCGCFPPPWGREMYSIAPAHSWHLTGAQLEDEIFCKTLKVPQSALNYGLVRGAKGELLWPLQIKGSLSWILGLGELLQCTGLMQESLGGEYLLTSSCSSFKAVLQS